MGFLDQSRVVVDAILTRKGREKMALGDFQITQFALADDEVDYTLYRPDHPSGSAFFGEAIESQPLLEAFPDETQIMKYKLVTLPRGTSKLPIINVGGYAAITLKQGASIVITPQTLNYLGATSTFEASGYSVTVGDARLLSTFTGIGIDIPSNSTPTNYTSGTALSKTQIGTSFTLTGTTIDTLFGTTRTELNTNITVLGRDSGASIVIPLTITLN